MTELPRSRFENVAELSRGATANVCLCRLQGVAGFVKQLAIKRIDASHAADPDAARRLLDEGCIAAQLNHANIVQVFEVGDEDGLPYVAMEYVRGVTLPEIIARQQEMGRIELAHVVQLGARIASALAHVHAAVDGDGRPLGFIHRDLCPANVVVAFEGVPKLIDFGLASTKQRFAPSEAIQIFKGDLRYVAPEQTSEATPLDQRVDVFSLGVILYELSTGENPFGPPGQRQAEVLYKVMSGSFPRPTELLAAYPEELETIVLSAMEADVNKRCPSARILCDRLEAFAQAYGLVSDQPAMAAWLRDLFPLLTAGQGRALDLSEPTAPTVPGALLAGSAEEPTKPAVQPGPPVLSAPLPALRRELDSSRSVPTAVERSVTKAPAVPPRRRPWRWAALAAGVGAAVVAVLAWNQRLHEGSETIATEPPPAQSPPASSPPASVPAPPAPGPTAAPAAPPGVSTPDRAPAAAAQRAAAAPGPTGENQLLGADQPATSGPQRPAESRTHGTPPRVRRRSVRARRAARAAEPITRPHVAMAERPAGDILAEGRPPRDVPGAPEAPPPPASPAPESPAPAPPPAPTRPAAALPAPPERAPAPGGATLSVMPKTPVPLPILPREIVPTGPAELARICQAVETAVINRAGVSPQFALGITSALRRQLPGGAPIYPIAMYYFIVREAALRHDNVTAAANLAAAHKNDVILQLRNKPGIERGI